MDKLFGIDISHWQGDLSIKQFEEAYRELGDAVDFINAK